ncbi:MAG: PHP domain-containing protein [Gemmataceae bacterium]
MTSLHTHSWFSLLEGANSPEGLVEQVVRLGHNSLALTDTNNLYGAMPFVEAARKSGIKPILGATLRFGADEAVALIADPSGYVTLCRILSGIHENPKKLADLLLANAAGLHVLTRHPGLAASLRDAFGDRVWIEVVRPHIGLLGDERKQLEEATRLGLPLVASTAAHVADADDYRIARIATALRTGKRIDQLPATLSVGPAHRLVSRAELRWRFRDVREAADNAERLADLLTGDPLPMGRSMAGSLAPNGADEHAHLAALCERGLRKRGDIDRNRLMQELALIAERKLAPHFLVMAEFARFAHRRHHPFMLRGSAANSLVAYLLEITDIDPMRFGLPVDRFLRPGVEQSTLEIDFDPKVREQAIDHLFRSYGRERTAMVGSMNVFEPRSAFRKSADMHGLTADQIDAVCESMGPRVEWTLRADPNDIRLRSAPRAFPLDSARWARILHDARRLLGRPHSLGVRPGGIAIAADRLDNHVPLQHAAEGSIVTQFDQASLAAAGVVTIELLGNRILGLADELQGYGFRTPKVEDPAVLELLRRGNTLGITQLESPAMRQALVQSDANSAEDVAAALANLKPKISRSHAAQHAMLAMQAVAHKVLHPPEFWAAALNNNHGTYPRRVYIEAMKQAGIRLLPPCVNRSHEGFTVEDGAVRVGLEAIGVLSTEVCNQILASRRSAGLFRDIADFTSRIETTRAMLSALIRCAAFEFAEAPRDVLLAGARKFDQDVDLRTIPGRLFSDDETDDLWTTPDAALRAQHFDELATLGFVVNHPMLSLFVDMLPTHRVRAKELPWHVGESVTVAGMLACVRETRGSDGRLQHWISLQDETALIDLRMDAESIKTPTAAEAGPYFATGLVCEKYDAVMLLVERLEPCRTPAKKKGKTKLGSQQFPKFFGEPFRGKAGVAG